VEPDPARHAEGAALTSYETFRAAVLLEAETRAAHQAAPGYKTYAERCAAFTACHLAMMALKKAIVEEKT
jgi:hypothetical protein